MRTCFKYVQADEGGGGGGAGTRLLSNVFLIAHIILLLTVVWYEYHNLQHCVEPKGGTAEVLDHPPSVQSVRNSSARTRMIHTIRSFSWVSVLVYVQVKHGNIVARHGVTVGHARPTDMMGRMLRVL